MADNIQSADEISDAVPIIDDHETAAGALREKLADAMTPGLQVEFDPEEATIAGAFTEDALSEEDAIESAVDLVDVALPLETQ